MIAVGLSFVAGLLTALSPCVLPALPIIVGSAAADRRHGPLALAAGLVVSFTVVGLALASLGPAIGLTDVWIRRAAALMLVLAGVVMLSARLQDRLSALLSPLASAAARSSAGAGRGLAGQFGVGAMLGAIWSPCVGPTLGAAVGLASSSATIGRAAVMMFAFGVGSALPLLVTAYASRRVMAARPRLLAAASRGKVVFGAALVLMGLFVLTGTDKIIEAAVLERLPQGWIELLASV